MASLALSSLNSTPGSAKRCLHSPKSPKLSPKRQLTSGAAQPTLSLPVFWDHTQLGVKSPGVARLGGTCALPDFREVALRTAWRVGGRRDLVGELHGETFPILVTEM